MFKGLMIMISCILVSTLSADEKSLKNDEYAFIKKITPDHPRLFLSQKIIANLKKRMDPDQKHYLDDMRKEIDAWPAMPKVIKVNDAWGGWGEVNDWGSRASRAALLFIFTGEEKYKDKSINYLKFSLNWYNKRYAEKKAIGWYIFSRIGAVCAYDWLYNYLSAKERKEIGESLFKHIQMTQDLNFTRKIPEEGPSGPTYGFYGVPNLAWYAGLAFYKNGINDKRALELIKKGYKDHVLMFTKRSENAGDKGGSNTASVAYAAGDYYIAEYNFFYTWNSAVGGKFADRFPKISFFPNWLLWTIIQGSNGEILEYGTGDAWHKDNRLGLPMLYLIQYRHFYDKINPKCSEIVDFLLTKIKQYKNKYVFYQNFLDSKRRNERHMCAIPFLFNIPEINSKKAMNYIKKMPHAENFSILGETFMNTGWDADSTYCLFTGGGANNAHKQFDENNFVIYKKGFLAIDSGTRGSTGMKDPRHHDALHMRNYYHRSIAHNCILIKMGNEKFPKHGYPVAKIPEANDGGMRRSVGSKLLAFETNNDFTYIACDATKTYNKAKAIKVVRQFVFVYPDFFVVYDTVVSKEPFQRKKWLLHFQNEPVISGQSIEATQHDGKIFCKTFLPVNAVIKKIGGLGQEFWCDGQNWPISEYREKDRMKKKRLYGNWRIEVQDAKPKKRVNFLHLIQVGDKKRMKSMTPAKLVENATMQGVEFKNGSKTVEVLFHSLNKIGGSIKIQNVDLPANIVEKKFSHSIQSYSL